MNVDKVLRTAREYHLAGNMEQAEPLYRKILGKKAASLAGDITRLQLLRRTLRDRMCQSPLLDGQRFTRELQGHYRKIWKDWVRGQEQ